VGKTLVKLAPGRFYHLALEIIVSPSSSVLLNIFNYKKIHSFILILDFKTAIVWMFPEW